MCQAFSFFDILGVPLAGLRITKSCSHLFLRRCNLKYKLCVGSPQRCPRRTYRNPRSVRKTVKTGRCLETRKLLPRHCQPCKRVSLLAYLVTKTITLWGRFFKPCFAEEESESQRNHYSRNLRKSLSSLSVWYRDSRRAKCQCFFLLKVSLEDIHWPRS